METHLDVDRVVGEGTVDDRDTLHVMETSDDAS